MPIIKRPSYMQQDAGEQPDAKKVDTQSNPFIKQGQTQTDRSGGVFSFLGNVGKAIGGFGIGAAKGVMSLPAEAASLGKNISERVEGAVRPDITYEELKQRHDATGIGQGIEKTTEQFAPKNTAEKVGFAAEKVGEFFVPVGAATKAKALLQAGETTSKIAKMLGMSEKAVSMLTKTANVGVKAVTEGAEQLARTALQEGEVNKEAVTAGLFGFGSEVAGKLVQGGLNKLGDAFYSLAIPSTILERGKDLRKQLDVGKAVSETGISLTRKKLVNKIGEKIRTFGNKLDSAVDAATQAGVGTSFDSIAQSAMKHIDDLNLGKEIQASPIDLDDAKVVIQETIDRYKGKYGTAKMDANTIQQLKRDIGSGLVKVFDRNMGAPVKAKALTETKLYGQLDNFLDKNVPGYKQLNEKLAPLLEGRDRLMKKGAYSGVLTDVIAASVVGSTGGSLLEDPVGFLKNAAYGVLLKRGLNSTAAKTTAGTISKQLGKAVSDPRFYQWYRQLVKASQESED